MKKLLATLGAAVFALLPLSACGESGDGLTTVKVNEVTHSVFYAPMYLADSLGYFEEEGIQIELTNGGGADAVMAAVLSGDADVGFCGPEAAIYVLLGGSQDVPTVFGQHTKRDGSFLVSRVDEADTFDWSTTLQGKEILAGRKGVGDARNSKRRRTHEARNDGRVSSLTHVLPLLPETEDETIFKP